MSMIGKLVMSQSIGLAGLIYALIVHYKAFGVPPSPVVLVAQGMSPHQEDAFGMRARPTVSFTGNVGGRLSLGTQILTVRGTLSVRFHCLPTAFDHIELTGIGVDVSSLSLLGPPLPGGSRRPMPASAWESLLPGKTRHPQESQVYSLTHAVLRILGEATNSLAKASESENADLRISLDLGIAKFRFSPWHFREFISFAKTTPPPDVVPIPLPGNPLQWRIRVTFREGELQWIDEATNKLFAVSRMQQSTVLLDLHQDTICFRSGLQNFTIQDQLSSRTPMILEYRQKAGYVLEINARTFLPKSLEFRGYQTEVSIRFQSVHLQYMGQKFLQCWQWARALARTSYDYVSEPPSKTQIFGAFLPAVTAGRRQPPPRQSPPSEDGDVPPPPRPPSLSRQASISPAQPAAANFVELAEGELAQESAWQAAEQVLRKAASDKDARLPALTRLRIFFDDLVVSVPLELGGRSEMPAVELRARSLVVSNGPGRRSGREALIDALALSARQVELWEVPVETRLLAPQDMTIHIDLNLQVQKPPLPMHVLWYASSAQWQLSSRGLALLRAGFSRNIAGIDPDVESQVTPDQNQLLHPQKYPIWLIFRLLWRNFRWQFQEEAKTFAELAAKQLVVEVKKHAAPRAQVSFSLWEARLTADEVPVALLMGRRPCAKAAARSGGRKGGASIHGEYISDHAKGQSFEIDGHRQRLLLLRPLLRRCWGFLFPKKPWFPPPPVMGARPSEELRVVATLPEAHILLVEKLQLKTAPLISVLTGLRYQLQSRSGVQWWLNFHGLEVIRCQSREAALELDGREDPSGCQLLTTEKHEVEFRVANAAAPPAEAAEGAPAPTETSASRLLVKALRLRVSNNDLRLLVASYRAAWGEDEEAPPEQFAVTEHVLEYRIPDVRVVLLSEHDTGPRNPFLDICGSDWVYVRCLRHLAPGANAESRVTGKARISIQLFNPNVGTFEPLLEGQETSTDAESEVVPGDRKWGIKVTRSSGPAAPSLPSTPTASVSAEENAGKFQPLREVIAVDCPEPLLLNATDAFWRTLPRHSMWLSLWRGGAEADESVVKEVPQSSDDFAPYAVRNDLGVPVLLRFPDKPSPLRLAPGAEQRLDAGKEEGEAAEGRPKRPVLAVQLETAGPVSFDEVGEITIDRLGRAVHPLVRSCGVAALTRSSRSYQGNQAMLAGLVEQQNARLSSRLSKEHMTRAASQPRLSRGGGDAADAGCLPLPYLVARVRAKEAYKLLLLESPVHVVNQLSVPVQLRLSATELPDEIPPLGAAPLPANLDVRDQLSVRPSRRRGAPWSRNFKLEQLLLGPPDGAFRSHNPVEGKPGAGTAGEVAGCAFCLVWKMESIHVQGAPDARQWTLSLHAPVTVVSSLPVPFTVEVRGAGAAPLRETLQPGKKRRPVTEARFTPCQGVNWNCHSPALPPQIWSPDLRVPLAVPVDEAGKQRINILIVMSWQLLEKPVVIAVHSPSWIADHVRSEQLRFIYPRQERTSSRMPGSSFSRMPDLCYVPLPPNDDVAGDPLAPRMLPLDCDATRIAVRLRQTESQALSLQAIQACTVQMAAKKEPDDNDQEPDFVFLGVRNTLQFTRIGDLSLEVRVVHVAPAQVAVNATGRPLNLRQSSRPRKGWGQGAGINVSKQVVSVPSGRRAAIHWSSPGKEPLWIRVQIADSPRWRWSGKLRVGEVGEYSFQCCAEHPNQWEIENLRVEVRSEEATTYFIFRLGSEATAPILLRNFSSEPILIQQASSDMSDEEKRGVNVDLQSLVGLSFDEGDNAPHVSGGYVSSPMKSGWLLADRNALQFESILIGGSHCGHLMRATT
ncbi:unnamed protein product [Symbiodinium natans]|uniref:Vacuolar protein sorting-associated protein 13 VPS13 adaptor binding domain-containing protein n=1 Tax=Symbiodinium natans TaxID=878477 RepID=A0A812IKW8_9DINO|nr:unnamed protein product [Symbiodinium natans]